MSGWKQVHHRRPCYRPGDYSIPFMRIVPLATTRQQNTIMGFEARIDHLPQLLTVTETPDRQRHLMWNTPRRFVFGGRRFVWKPLNMAKGYVRSSDNALFEYKTTTPKDGSKTGKMDDDALTRKLFWTENHEKIAFSAAGLDPLLKEYLLAIVMTKSLVIFHDAQGAAGDNVGVTGGRGLLPALYYLNEMLSEA